MESNFSNRRIVRFVFVVVAGAALMTYHMRAHCAAAAATVTGHSDSEAASPPGSQTENVPSQPSSSSPDDPSVFASVAETEVTQLREGITLAKWIALHGKDQGWKRVPIKKLEITDWPRRECLSYVKRESLPSGAELVRAVYFYPPPVPSPIVFPTLGPPELIDSCVLAIVLVEATPRGLDFGPERPGNERAHPLDQAAQERFTRLYGQSVGMRNVPFWGPALSSYEDASRWTPHAEIISGYDPKGLLMPDQDQLAPAPFSFVSARLPLVRDFETQTALSRFDPAMEAVRFHRAVVEARVNAVLAQRMEDLYKVDASLARRLQAEAEEICKTRCTAEAMPVPRGDDWKKPLVPTLQDWFKELKAADTGRRAAGLVAADRLLTAFASIRPGDRFGGVQSSTPEQSKRRSELQELGATFESDFADAHYDYTGNWLNQAKDLDRDSKAGTLALVTWMSNGDVCGQPGFEAFRTIISEGEALLSKNIDAATAAQVHFMVGDAYSDVVAIAAGESGGNGEYDPTQYESEAEADRSKALQHYRAGLELDNRSEYAKNAWRQAWHLAAGLLPNEHYVCLGD